MCSFFQQISLRICYVPEFLPDSGNTDGPALRKLLLWWKTQESKQTIKAQCNRHYIVISVECFEILAMACETSREAVIIPVLQMRKLRFNKYNDLSKITNLVNGSLRTWTQFSWFLTEMFLCCRSLYPIHCKTIKGYYVYLQCIASAEHNVDSSTVVCSADRRTGGDGGMSGRCLCSWNQLHNDMIKYNIAQRLGDLLGL